VHVGTHFLTGWLVALPTGDVTYRERGAIACAGVAPDLDGLGLLIDKVIRATGRESYLYEDWHHVLAHNLGAALVFTAACAAVARQGHRRTVGLLALLSVHLHLFFDLLGSRGTDGGQWPIPYLAPFSQAWQLTWSGQWTFNSWQNTTIIAVVLLLTLYGAWKYGRSPAGLFSANADTQLTATLRARFGEA
jgi:ABC-type branched-subunit amino acid transport system permease subunit